MTIAWAPFNILMVAKKSVFIGECDLYFMMSEISKMFILKNRLISDWSKIFAQSCAIYNSVFTVYANNLDKFLTIFHVLKYHM